MRYEQESKYEAQEGQIINRATGVPIPEDEPVFVLRAKDRQALRALRYYRDGLKNPPHVVAVNQRIEQFEAFADAHPERMKEPDTTLVPVS